MAKGGHSSTRAFSHVESNRPGRSVFDLSHRKLLSCDFGQLIPVLCEEMVPGDTFKIGAQMLVRFTPMIAPIMHEVNAYIHYFFVPYRLLWPKPDYEEAGLEEGNWEEFITGGVQGDNDDTIPKWSDNTYTAAANSLFDYFGFTISTALPVNSLPMAFPKRAYNLVYNEYYRDETLIEPIDLDDNDVKYRCWEKDYFTSALPWQQRGTAPALPVTITGSAVWPQDKFVNGSAAGTVAVNAVSQDTSFYVNSGEGRDNLRRNLNANTLDADAVTFDINDLRLAFQLQRFMELNARAGVRYTEFLKAQFGENPRDDRLQRPEYIGGVRNPIIVSEVLQTSASNTQPTPQGNMSGHGISADNSYAGSYHAQEFGCIIGMLSIMPRSMYSQGIDRQWLRKTRYDFYFPAFAHLGEQGIENMELYATATDATNHALFGYQGRYDEMRFKKSLVTSDFRDTFDYWHLGRKFSSQPSLNKEFISMSAAENTELKRIFADQTDHAILVSIGNIIEAIRPLPVMPLPGYIDH